MLFLLDTNAFSDLMREHPQLDARLASTSPTDRVVICSVVRGKSVMVLNVFLQASGDRN